MNAVANVSEFDSGADRSTTNYDAINERLDLDNDPPDGLIVHAAGFSGNTFRIITIWATSEHMDRFEHDRLIPALRAVVGRSAPPPRIESYELHRLIAPGVLEATGRS